MSRSPLFYPLHRGDADAGGANDLQTDIMRFMAILALCLVAIFALVQSIPLAPEPVQPTAAEAVPAPVAEVQPAPAADPEPPEPAPTTTVPVRLTRPQPAAATPVARHVVMRPAAADAAPVTAAPAPEQPPAAPVPTQRDGFTLRFESDLALTRLVAAGQVGFYALSAGRAQRMTVSDSRISFWDASAPNQFHEMETSTVPRPVVDALARSGVETAAVDWGVTLPGKLRRELDALLSENSGGALVIGADGRLRLEAS